MGWNHPDISLEELMKLIKGFIDILILLSGYQSSGRFAHWDSHNIKKVFQWGLFFENLLGSFSCSDDYVESVMELDAAISDMSSIASFPKGLAHMSSATLSTARHFVLGHLIHSLPLRDEHLRALLTATVEMDMEVLSETEHDVLSVYLDKLKLHSASFDHGMVPVAKIDNCYGDGLTKFTVQELMKRWSAASVISTVGAGLDVLSHSVGCSSWSKLDDNLLNEQLKHENTPATVDRLVGSLTWSRWRSRSLSYFLDKRLVQLVSGASMIFSAPKIQWVQIFERLNMKDLGGSDDDMCQTIELMLLGCMTSRWTSVIKHLLSVTYSCRTISEQYHDVCNLLHGSTTLNSKQEATGTQELDILEFLNGMLESQLHQLWNISPVLGAAAIPSWSPLFRLYLNEIQIQVRGDFSTLRCCDCAHNRKEHNDCELAHRIWCLYIFHACGSQTTA